MSKYLIPKKEWWCGCGSEGESFDSIDEWVKHMKGSQHSYKNKHFMEIMSKYE